jgi:hypothetical protein
VNRLKVWIFTLVVVGAGAAALFVHARSLRADVLGALDARLETAARQASASLRATLLETAAAAALAAREPALRAALAPEAEPPPPPRKPGRTPAPRPPARAAPDVALHAAAASAALEGAEQALGGALPAGRVSLAANLAVLSRSPVGGDADALLRGAAEGTARAAFARAEGKLWAAAGAPAGESAGLVVLVPLGEAWARSASDLTGVDVTVTGSDLKAVGNAPLTEVQAIVAAATRTPGKPAAAGKMAPVDVGIAALPFQVPKVGFLLGGAPSHRVRAVPLEGLKGVAVVLSVPAGPVLAGVVALEWRGLALLALLLLVGLIFGFLVKPSEIVPAVPENLVAAASRIERGEFSTRAPQLAGKLGTIAAALNRAAEAAEGVAGGGAPGGAGSQELFASQAHPPEAEPSAFDFPSRPPRARPVEEARPALSGDPFQAAPVGARAAPSPFPQLGTPPEHLQPPARPAPPPIPNATMTRTMPAMSGPDDETSHWQQVFDDFVRTRNECGEPSEGLTFDRFRTKLEANKATLVAKYQCKTVRFQVYVKDGKAALKATPVR